MNITETNLQQQTLQDQLIALARKLQNPLSTLRALNDAISQRSSYIPSEEQTQTLVENSRKIVELVENLSVNYVDATSTNPLPVIFGLYNTVPTIKESCAKRPDSTLIAKTDLGWLVKLENTVFQEIAKRKINLIDLAYELAVSERQLHRNTKNFLGLTPNSYIRILKLHRAKQYLEDYTYRTISEVAYAVGFNDTHYFSKIFFHQYGHPPRELIPA